MYEASNNQMLFFLFSHCEKKLFIQGMSGLIPYF